MKKISTLFLFILIILSCQASVNNWVGTQEGSNNWSDASNWTNGVPSVGDTVVFNAVTATVNVDIAPNIAGLKITGSSAVVFSSSSSILMTIGNLNSSGPLVFFIEQLSSLTLEGTIATKGVSIQTFGNFTTTRAKVDGTLIFGSYTCSWFVNSFPASFCTTDISGIIRVGALNTGSVISGGISNGNAGTVSFLNGSLLEWLRSGGSAPNANFQNGSLISIKGIAGSNLNFNAGAQYNGLLVWDCPQQTVSGGSAVLLPSTFAKMDSIKVINTGSGSLRLTTNPNGYTINSVEVNGGVLELSAPNSNFSATLTDTIANELKITGGTVYGNATFNFDNLGSAFANTLLLQGNFIMTGGTFDFTNRSAGNLPGGSFTLFAKGNVLQTGGRIKATQSFGNQNQLILNGTQSQNLSLTNITDTVSLSINNTAGVILQNNMLLPHFLNLQGGYLQFNQYDVTVSAGKIIQAAVLPAPRCVTNGNGKLIVPGIVAQQVFPVAPFVSGYNPVTITNNNTAIPFTIKAGVEFGIRNSATVDVFKNINRTWSISSSPGINSNAAGLTFQYADSEKVVGATVVPSAAMLLGHYKTFWNYDPYLPVTPQGTANAYTAGIFSPESIDSFYIIGNANFITTTYIFTGTGNWDISANWLNNAIPPNPLPAGREIIIDPASGSCVLNISQSISQSAKITVNQNKNLVIPGNLIIQ